jgi:IS30 family transposase
VSGTLAVQWFGQAGGVSPLELVALSGRYLSIGERERIMVLHAQRIGVREIARQLHRSPSTVSRELARNSTRHGGYTASVAQHLAEQRATRPKRTRLGSCPRLRDTVQDMLAARLSPEQIAGRLRLEFPDDPEMRVSHETIYRGIYVQGRGDLRRDLAKCLRTGRAVRKPARRVDGRREIIKDKVMISERPAEVEDRAVPGHWEGDLIIGANSASAIGTLVERTSRAILLLHLPDRHGAEQVRDAITETIPTLPEQLWRSLTWDQGIEMAQHVRLTTDTDLQVYFCDPSSPWQRATNENSNGLLRQYFPKSTDLSVHTRDDLTAVAAEINARPRKSLGFYTPAEVLTAILNGTEPQVGVATVP